MPLIVFEGIDGTGKSTQAKMLATWLATVSDCRVILEAEPTYSKFGNTLRSLSSKPRAKIDPWTMHALFTMDRLEHVREVVSPALERNEIVILDRYYYSTTAYQGALGVPVERILEDNRAFAPEPDLAFVLMGDPKILSPRIGKRKTTDGLSRLFEKNRTYQDAVQKIYEDLVNEHGHLFAVEAEYPFKVVHQAVKQMVQACLPDIFT